MNQTWQSFASVVSHQLNQPLTALRGSLELALTTAHTIEDYRKSIETALEQTDRVILLKQILLAQPASQRSNHNANSRAAASVSLGKGMAWGPTGRPRASRAKRIPTGAGN